MAIIGLDVGTSGCKACCYDFNGKMLSAARRSYMEIRSIGVREINPSEVRDAIMEVLTQTALNSPETIDALAITCLGESLIFLDKDDQCLYNSMVTGDARGQAEVEQLCETIGADKIFSITGLVPSQLYSLPKMMWLHNNTDIIKHTDKIFFYEDYVGYLLTGKRKISYSSAARSMALDIHNLNWNAQLLSMAGLRPQHFSVPVASGSIVGTVTPEMAKLCHLSPSTIVVAGGHDQGCAALGSGMMDYSIAEDSIGTCECIAFMLPPACDQSILQRLQMPIMPYPITGKYFTTLEITTCGALTNWAKETLFHDKFDACETLGLSFFQYMDQNSAEARSNIYILPQFGSSGHPDLNYNMSGTICGLKLESTQEEIYLALKESMIYQLRMALECTEGLGLEQFKKLVMTGGAANSQLSARLRADIFKKDVCTLHNPEAGTVGCMILASVAVGHYPSIEKCVQQVVHYTDAVNPQDEQFAYHEKKYHTYCSLYEKMHDF